MAHIEENKMLKIVSSKTTCHIEENKMLKIVSSKTNSKEVQLQAHDGTSFILQLNFQIHYLDFNCHLMAQI